MPSPPNLRRVVTGTTRPSCSSTYVRKPSDPACRDPPRGYGMPSCFDGPVARPCASAAPYRLHEGDERCAPRHERRQAGGRRGHRCEHQATGCEPGEVARADSIHDRLEHGREPTLGRAPWQRVGRQTSHMAAAARAAASFFRHIWRRGWHAARCRPPTCHPSAECGGECGARSACSSPWHLAAAPVVLARAGRTANRRVADGDASAWAKAGT
jgi:hypothetical protein